ncbi:MAG: 4-hydroxythreonine-4-phosphate dehydrogenase PdxA [Pseudomonadota bacterium]
MVGVPRILLTTGEPAGIGPDIVVQLAQQHFTAELCVVADPALLQARARMLGLPLTLVDADLTNPPLLHNPGELTLLPVSLNAPCTPGKLSTDNAPYVMQCLAMGADLTLKKKADALVTGPVHKSIINDAGIAFTGHTEFLADFCQARQVLMLFVVDCVKVALATTHIPLAQVPAAITAIVLREKLQLLHAELNNKFHLPEPKILVCGLNPHAGEAGHLGREEIDIIGPALAELRAANINVIGPLPADTIFTKQVLAGADAVFAMYHDQALPVVKYLGFDRAVNVTLGLPIIRTSVDHGTALRLAGTGQADPGSLVAAVRLAVSLCHSRAGVKVTIFS